MIAFTICARNFLAQALVLHDSLQRSHPDVAFHVALCDLPDGIERDAFPFPILLLEQLGLPDLEGMIRRYNISELNTSIKPFVFRRLFERFPGEPVVYFDPDILVLSPLEELLDELRRGADCVLTPHLTEPAEFAEMNERQLLGFGAYNLGFLALRDTEEVRRVVSWWGRRLEQECRIDLPAGLFVDQKWADLLPSFIGRTALLRHPGYNVAYWNLATRTIRRTPEGWRANGEPLRFFHFSGSVVDEPLEFSRHSAAFRLGSLRDVADLFFEYAGAVRRFGREHYRRIPYGFSWGGPSGENLHAPCAVGERALAAAGGDGIAAGGTAPHLPLLRAGSFEDYTAQVERLGRAFARRRALEESLIPAGRDPFSIRGRCAVCGGPAAFITSFLYSPRTLPDGRPVPNWREHLACIGCRFSNRLRASLHVLFQELRPARDARIYLTEAVTPLHAWLKARFPGVVGSEYFGAERSPGESVNGVRHEDVQRLSFADGSFDVILSFDVLEHVPWPERAFAELARCLRPGGTLLFTVPFGSDRPRNLVRAVIGAEGAVEHLLPPEIHGNPVDAEGGALCFRYFGWEVLDDLRAAGFADAEAWFYWSRDLGYLGDTNSLIVARR